MSKELEGQESCADIRKGFRLVTCNESLKSVVALNLNDGFELYMLDIQESQTVIDLSQRMKDECLIDTKKSKIVDCYWTTINSRRVAFITFDNGNNVCFDQSGMQVRLLSDALYGQTILSNLFQFFLSGKINKRVESGPSPPVWALSKDCITYFTGLNFQTFAITPKPCKFPKRPAAPSLFKRCRQLGKGFPFVTVCSEVVLDSKLFHNSERVLLNLFFACRLQQREPLSFKYNDQIGLYQVILQGYHTVVFLMRQQEYLMAMQALNFLKGALESVPHQHGEADYPQAVVREQLQLLKQDTITTYHREEPSEIDRLVDKGVILQSLACMILFKLLHQKSNLLHQHS